ncbi:YczE/YyaS/YitT family protein [Effusibacillus consociatus]|uniref:YitT family protein n=1 Tax=Effusibacillus consociatus TaxID=1117041 RepID=A0ABV9Q351_9BACL
MGIQTHTSPTRVQRIVFTNLLAVKRLFVFILGLLIMCYGIVAVVNAGFGVSPWDVLHLGISQNTGLSFGRVSQLVGLVILASASILMKKLPSFGAIANMILVGEFIDLLIHFQLVPQWEHWAARIGLFVGGLFIWGFGTGVYIQSQLGAGPRDWLMLAFHEKTGWAIRWVRTFLEVTAVTLGLWLGGPFSWGTIVFSLTIGHSTEFGFRMAKKLFGRFTERREVA